MRRKNIKVIAIAALTSLSGIAAVFSSIAWFASGASIAFGNGSTTPVTAGSEASFFGGGSGTSGDPFIISNRTHLYNLAWLQYIGAFNDESCDLYFGEPGDGILQYYFKLADDINMSGITLPPIGTEKYPFYGHFDGLKKSSPYEVYKISNLTVSNAPVTSSDFGVAKPTDLFAGEMPDTVGFFGAVGKLPGSEENVRNTSMIGMSNFNLDTITINTKSPSYALVGLAGGYVNGTMSGVTVGGNSALSVNGQKAKAVYTTKLSDYGLVGYAENTDVIGSAGYSQSLSKYYASEDADHGGADWGGTFDSQSYLAWIYKNFTAYSQYTDPNNPEAVKYLESSQLAKGDTKTISNNYFNMSWKIPNTTNTHVTTVSSYYGNKYDRYANPDLIDTPPYGFELSSPYSNFTRYVEYEIKDATYLPLKFEQDKLSTAYSSLTVSSNNTGYLTGNDFGNSNNNSSAFGSFYYGAISNSLVDNNKSNNSITSNNNNDVQYDSSKLEILTYSVADGDFRRISDSYNANHPSANVSDKIKGKTKKTVSELGLQKYNDTREKLETMFQSRTRLQGIHFTRGNVNTNYLGNYSNVKIMGNDYSSYQLPKGAIDFNLKNDGYITYFAGGYNSNSVTTVTFFSLYKINRYAANHATKPNQIESIQKIAKVYENPFYSETNYDGPKYFYELNNYLTSGTKRNTYTSQNGNIYYSEIVDSSGTKRTPTSQEVSNATLLCDLDSSTSTNLYSALFYYEIPVNDGEYALGNVHSATDATTSGGYLIYLDIGVNGASDANNNVSGYSITTESSGYEYPIGVDFAVAGTNTGTSTSLKGGISFGATIESQTIGTSTFVVTTNLVSITSPNNGSSILSKFAFKGSGYVDTSPPSSSSFNVTGGPSSTVTTISQKVRVSHISVPLNVGGRTEILVIDQINSGGNITSTKYQYGQSVISSNDNNNVPVIPPSISNDSSYFDAATINKVRALTEAIKLARNPSGTLVDFDSVLPTMPWANYDTYIVTLSPATSGLKINASRVDKKYILKIGTTTVFTGDDLIATYTVS